MKPLSLSLIALALFIVCLVTLSVWGIKELESLLFIAVGCKFALLAGLCWGAYLEDRDEHPR